MRCRSVRCRGVRCGGVRCVGDAKTFKGDSADCEVTV